MTASIGIRAVFRLLCRSETDPPILPGEHHQDHFQLTRSPSIEQIDYIAAMGYRCGWPANRDDIEVYADG